MRVSLFGGVRMPDFFIHPDTAYFFSWTRAATVPKLGSGAAHMAENGSIQIYSKENKNSIRKSQKHTSVWLFVDFIKITQQKP